MASNFKISDLTPLGRDPGDSDVLIINDASGIQPYTRSITFADLLAKAGGGAARSFMVNFPDDPGFNFETPNNNQYIAGTSNAITGSRGQFVQTTDLYDVWNAVTPVTITMPEGTDSAIVNANYTVGILPAPSSTSGSTGYANFGYEVQCSADTGPIRWSPGGGAANKFGFMTRLNAPQLDWAQYTAIPADVRGKRAPANTAHPSRTMRIFFPESTAAVPTKLTFSVFGQIYRMKNCNATMGTGKIMVIPYKNDGLDPFSRLNVNAYSTGYDPDDFVDDGGIDEDAFEQEVSSELKSIMNYYTNAIHEALDFDPDIKGDAAKELVLNDAMADIFAMKKSSEQDLNYYYNELKRIRNNVAPYVGFRFGFEQRSSSAYDTF